MITLYYGPRSRAGRIVWLMEELGVPYERKTVTIKRADGSDGPDPENPHPHKKIPAISHNGEIVYESPAIVLYITDLYPEKGLAPAVGEKNRGAYLSWLSYCTAVIEPSLTMKVIGQDYRQGLMGWGRPEDVLNHLTTSLQKSPYILGENFSAADIIIGGSINYMMMVKMMPETDLFKTYVARLTSRPAYKRFLEIDARG